MNSSNHALGEPIGPGGALAIVPAGGTQLVRDYGFDHGGESDLIDLRKIWSATYRNRYVILAILAAALALGVLSLFVIDPTYRATSSVEIDQQTVKVLGTEDSEPFGGSDEAERLLQTQVDVLKSRALAERVASSLNLTANDNFLVAMGENPVPGARTDMVVSTLMSNLGVTVPRNSRVVPVSFDSHSPSIAAAVANSYAENLIAGNLQRRYDTSDYSKKFLQTQLSLTKARLENSERALLSYARSVGLVDPTAGTSDGGTAGADNGDSRSLTTSNLVQLNNALAAARTARIQAQQRWQQAQSAPVMSSTDVLSNSAIQQMMQRRAELEADYQTQLQHRKPDHPSVQQAAAALKEMDGQIGALAGSIRSSIRNQYVIAQNQESAISGNVSKLKGAVLAEQGLGIRYNILKREVDTNRQLYDGLLQRYKEVSAQAGVTSNNISIVDRAHPPREPVAPSATMNLALALLGGLIAAAGFVIVRELFQDGIRSPDEIEDRFGLPVLGSVPLLNKHDTALTVLKNPKSAVTEAYQSVLASIELSSSNGTPRTLLVTSGRPREGKSTTALAIARSLAHSGKRTLLVDADMRRPSLHKLLFDVQRAPGLSNLLTNGQKLEEAIQQTDTPNLYVIAAGPNPPSPAELLASSRFRDLIRSLREDYDHIVIDSPPVLGLADAPQIAAVAEGTMMVVEANRADRGAITAAVSRLTSARARLVGAVLVKFDPRNATFGASYMADYYAYAEDNESDNAAAQPVLT